MGNLMVIYMLFLMLLYIVHIMLQRFGYIFVYEEYFGQEL